MTSQGPLIPTSSLPNAAPNELLPQTYQTDVTLKRAAIMSETKVFCTLALLGGGLFLLVTVTSLNWYYPTIFYGIVAFVAFQRYFGAVEDGSQPPGPRQAN